MMKHGEAIFIFIIDNASDSFAKIFFFINYTVLFSVLRFNFLYLPTLFNVLFLLCCIILCYDCYRSALLVQLYIRIDRLDLAESQVKVMKNADEDSTLSMLAGAWTNLSMVSFASILYYVVNKI